MKFSLVIPCYNEAANLPLLLARCRDLVSRPGIEVILVDNGSTDCTSAVLQSLLPTCLGCRSVRVDRNQGYGFGILSGLAAARGDVVGWTHADMQTDPLDVLHGLELFETHGDRIFVKGRRCGRPLTDAAFTVGMSVFETLLLARPLWDINAQPTMFSRAFYNSWQVAPKDYSLDLYAYYHALRQGLSIHRFPVRVRERVHGSSHWNVSWAAKRKLIRRTVDFSLGLRNEFDHDQKRR
ncbi:glycosyltransferase family 2 protein [Steroidobacter sp. S1-65]|uniref:Glycosyltransferase family 2 protein n=1 Tax=Steroidobacter gossypii TaxID=2805490 RepID=A0ABS1X6P7_9GAMM|nr:glycosyltransferase family 2 protein [Steroidobacter gossypii]MBM0108880.1 glycosyltransferase family 2 protein [Steroidobacter gossypii]